MCCRQLLPRGQSERDYSSCQHCEGEESYGCKLLHLNSQWSLSEWQWSGSSASQPCSLADAVVCWTAGVGCRLTFLRPIGLILCTFHIDKQGKYCLAIITISRVHEQVHKILHWEPNYPCLTVKQDGHWKRGTMGVSLGLQLISISISICLQLLCTDPRPSNKAWTASEGPTHSLQAFFNIQHLNISYISEIPKQVIDSMV